MNKRILALLTALLLLLSPSALAQDAGETDGDEVYVMYDLDGNRLASRAGRMYEGDGLIASNNAEYVVVRVDEESRVAYAERIEEPEEAREALSLLAEKAKGEDGEKKLICLYCTHSDESYEPTDGESSLIENAGIYDVSEAFAESLKELGVEVKRSEETFLPHDSGAYRRSRSTAEEFAKLAPAAMFDIHRDGIPDSSEYEESVQGEDIAQVRLLVGRSNENSDVNKEFAKQVKATADKEYPGLIRDIYIGKGNYNQELYPKALLLEFGTYTNDKELVLKSTDMMANTISKTLFSGKGTPEKKEADGELNAGAMKGAAWIIGILIVAGLAYALVSTGTLKNLGAKLGSGTSELTGGLFGNRRKKDDEK